MLRVVSDRYDGIMLRKITATLAIAAPLTVSGCDIEIDSVDIDTEELTLRGLMATDGFTVNGMTQGGLQMGANGLVLTDENENELAASVVSEIEIDGLFMCYCVTQSLHEGRAVYAPVCCVNPYATW